MPYNNLVEQSFFEILEDTRLLLGDVQSVTTSWSDATIYGGINFAVQHYLRITDKSYTEHFDFPISGGVATLPNAYIEVKRVGVEIDSKNRWLLQSSVTDEVNKNPEWLFNITNRTQRSIVGWSYSNLFTIKQNPSLRCSRGR